jgi:dihydroorotase
MTVDLTIKKCKIWYKDRLVNYGLALDRGKIVSISKDTSLPASDEKIDCKGNIILPGLIDVHVHFREPGLTWKEDWLTGSKSAAKGGITYVMDMPNTIPPTTTVERLLDKKKLAKKSIVNFDLYAAICSDNLDLIPELSKHVKAFKLYMAQSTGKLMLQENLLKEAFTKVSKAGKILCVHAEDQKINDRFLKKYKKRNDPLAFALSRPKESEVSGIKKAINLTRETNVKLHVCHVSSKEGLDLIRTIKKEIDITCEVTPHNLFMTQEDFIKKGNFAKMGPPLRTKQDQIALWKGINDGTVDILASDHAPHTLEEKSKDIWSAPAGVPGVETSLQLMLNVVNKRMIGLERVVELMYDNPVKRFDLGNYGMIEKGNVANLTIVNLNKQWKISREDLLTKCGWNPFEGWEGKGETVLTIVNGKTIFNR